MSMPSPKTRPVREHMWWRVVALVVGLPVFLVLALSLLSAASDAGRVPSELAASKRESGVMLCSEGRIDRDSDSIFDRVFDGGRFRCTAWRMRRSLVDSSTGATAWPTSPRR
jgi:hypothetical protein